MDLSCTMNTNNASMNAEKKRRKQSIPVTVNKHYWLLDGKQRRGAYIGVIIIKAKGKWGGYVGFGLVVD